MEWSPFVILPDVKECLQLALRINGKKYEFYEERTNRTKNHIGRAQSTSRAYRAGIFVVRRCKCRGSENTEEDQTATPIKNWMSFNTSSILVSVGLS